VNSKKARLLRKVLKKGGVDWRQAKHVQRMNRDHQGNEQREPTIFLDPKCGRAIYRMSKRMAKVRGLV
tara:strand:- start:548 stop:751 length:204 start_codon:yes stop_codon:yes gene_type:complete